MSGKGMAVGVWVLVMAVALGCGGTGEEVEPVEEQATEVMATEVVATDVPPTAESTPSVPALEILSHRSYVDGEWFYIVGEVRNNSDAPMEYVKVVATLYNGDEQVVGTEFTYTSLDVLDIVPPRSKSPFKLMTNEWMGVTNYVLLIEGEEGELGRQDLVIRSHEHYIDGEWLKVRGEVENTGTREAEYVKVVVTLYDGAGEVVGVEFTYTSLDTIPAGGRSPFEVMTNYWEGFERYEVQVEGGG